MSAAMDWLQANDHTLAALSAWLKLEAAQDAVGYPDSPLWFSLEAPACDRCGEYVRRDGVRALGSRIYCAACAIERNEQYYRDQPRVYRGGPAGPLDGVEE